MEFYMIKKRVTLDGLYIIEQSERLPLDVKSPRSSPLSFLVSLLLSQEETIGTDMVNTSHC